MPVKIFRQEGALEALEAAKKTAAESGSAAVMALEERLELISPSEAQNMGMIDAEASAPASDDSSDSDNSDDGGGDIMDMDEGPSIDEEPSAEESSEEETAEETPEEESADETASSSEEDKARVESFRSLSFLPELNEGSLRIESFSKFWSFSGDSAAFVFRSFLKIGTRLTPALLKGFSKIVIFTFAQCFSVLSSVFDLVSQQFERYQNDIKRQREMIQALKKTLETFKEDAYDPERVVETDVTYLQGDADSFTRNVQAFEAVMNNEVLRFQKSLLSEFEKLELIAKARYLQKSFDSSSQMNVNAAAMGFTFVEEGPESDMVDRHRLDTRIGQVNLEAWLPKSHLDTWQNIEKAYKNSSIRLVVIDDAKVSKESIQVLSPAELGVFLNSLESLLLSRERHQGLFREIESKKVGVIGNIRALFTKLASEHSRSTLKSSTALPLQLKSRFVAKVYVVGAIDLQDHLGRVIANGLSFAESMMKTYRNSDA